MPLSLQPYKIEGTKHLMTGSLDIFRGKIEDYGISRPEKGTSGLKR